MVSCLVLSVSISFPLVCAISTTRKQHSCVFILFHSGTAWSILSIWVMKNTSLTTMCGIKIKDEKKNCMNKRHNIRHFIYEIASLWKRFYYNTHTPQVYDCRNNHICKFVQMAWCSLGIICNRSRYLANPSCKYFVHSFFYPQTVIPFDKQQSKWNFIIWNVSQKWLSCDILEYCS